MMQESKKPPMPTSAQMPHIEPLGAYRLFPRANKFSE
jgi:hypothetical protein